MRDLVANDAGLSDFHALRSAITRLYFVAFDLLHLNSHDLRDMVLKDRREILQALIPLGGRIQFSESLPGSGDAVYHLACETNLEGVVSKRLDSVYQTGSTMNWRIDLLPDGRLMRHAREAVARIVKSRRQNPRAPGGQHADDPRKAASTLAILHLQVEIVGDTLPQNAYELGSCVYWPGSQA